MKIGTLCYITKKNKTLMMHRVKKKNDMHKNKWNGLGGKVIPGETPEECIIREVKEESGLELIEPIFKGIITFPKFDGLEDWIVFVFVAGKFTGNLMQSSEGILKWIPNENLMELELWEGDKIFMNWLNNKKIFSAKFIYNKKSLENYQVVFY